MSVERPVAEDDLQAYVDGALDPARRSEIDGYLGQHTDVARRVEGYARQREALRAALAPYAEEPLPPELSLSRLLERRPRAAPPWWQAVAAVILLAVGGAGGWSLRTFAPAGQGGMTALAQEASDSYAVFGPDRAHPVEIKADDRDALVRWLSTRLDRPVSIPDLAASGYRFMGGRLVATPHGPAGLFMYDDDHGSRVAMLVRPMAGSGDAPMTEHEQGRTAGYTWAQRGMGYSLVGDSPNDALHPLANEMRRQIGSRA